MYFKLLLFIGLSIGTLLNAMDTSMMPPMVPSINSQTSQQIGKKETTLGSCEMIPPMIINLPPPLESALVACKNEQGMPQKDFVEKQLSKLFKKKTKVISIEIVKKFNQLYKVTYEGGVILCNKSVDAFVKQ